MQKVPRWFSLLLFIIVAGCSKSAESAASSSPVVSASPVISTLLAETELPATAPIATDTPTQAPSPTDLPMLSVEDARKELLHLLATNAGCRLPCLWGITPGKSSSQEARNALISLSSISPAVLTYFDPARVRGVLLGTISPRYVEGDQRLNSDVTYLYGDDGLVSSLRFRVLEERVTPDPNAKGLIIAPIFDSPTFGKRTDYYSLSHVLNEQGVPASVMIAASGLSGYPVIAGGIQIALLYPDRGIWVNYAMPMYSQGGTRRGCPANAHVEMELYPPGEPDSFFSSLEKTNWQINKSGYRPLEEATSMSVEEFYQTFRNPTDKSLETPANLWPVP